MDKSGSVIDRSGTLGGEYAGCTMPFGIGQETGEVGGCECTVPLGITGGAGGTGGKLSSLHGGKTGGDFG